MKEKKDKKKNRKKAETPPAPPVEVVSEAPAEEIVAEAKSSKRRGKKAKSEVRAEIPQEAPVEPTIEAAPEVAPVEEKKSKKRKKKGQKEVSAITTEQSPALAEVAENTNEAAAESEPEVVTEVAAPKKKRGKKKQEAAAEESASGASEAPPEEAPAEAAVLSDAAPTEGESNNGTETAGEEGEAPAETVDFGELSRTIQALLFAAEEPIQVREIARAAGSDSATVRKVLPLIKEEFEKERKPWDIAEVANGWRMVTRPEFFPAIQRLKTQTAQRKLTQPALETLALIAYKQPLGRAEIESVRGVNAGPVLRLLLDKKLIKISGRGTGLGQPLLYGTTDHFLEHFGLKSIQELPKAGEFKGA